MWRESFRKHTSDFHSEYRDDSCSGVNRGVIVLIGVVMQVGWLIDASAFELEYEATVAAVEQIGGIAKVINRPKPPYGWSDVGNSFFNAFPPGACVVTRGDIDLVNRVRADGRWTPGVFATIENYRCSHYFAHLGRFLLNRDYVMLPFAELGRCADFLFEICGRNGQIFIRPDSPLKIFTGQVATRETFEKDLEFMGFYEFPRESLVVVSSPKLIDCEWRFVVANQTVVAGSHYRERGIGIRSTDVDPAAWRLAEEIVTTGFAPDPVWVLDVCRTQAGEYALLEIGAFSFAELYACDQLAVVRAISETAQQSYNRHEAGKP